MLRVQGRLSAANSFIPEHVLLDLPNLRIVLLEKVGIVLGHFLGTMAGHDPELFVGDASAAHGIKEVTPAVEDDSSSLTLLLVDPYGPKGGVEASMKARAWTGISRLSPWNTRSPSAL